MPVPFPIPAMTAVPSDIMSRGRDEGRGQEALTMAEWGLDGTATARYGHSDKGTAGTYGWTRMLVMAAATSAVLATGLDDLFLLNPSPDSAPTVPQPSAVRAIVTCE